MAPRGGPRSDAPFDFVLSPRRLRVRHVDRPLLRVFDLAFLDHPLESLLRVLDPVLEIGAIGRKQPHALVSAVGDPVADGPRGEIDRMTNTKLVFFQRALLDADDHGIGLLPCGTPPTGSNIAQKAAKAPRILLRSAAVPERSAKAG